MHHKNLKAQAWVLLLPNLPPPRCGRTFYKTGFRAEKNYREYCSIPLVVTKELLTPLGTKRNVFIWNKNEIMGWRIPNGDIFLSELAYSKLDKLIVRYFEMNDLIVEIIIALEFITSAFRTCLPKSWVSLSFQLTEDTQFMNFNVLFSVLSWVLFLNLYLKSYLK